MGNYRRVLVPMMLAVALVALQVLGAYGVIIAPSAFVEGLTNRLESATLLLVATFSFFEALAIFNAYFPGSVVILISMASTSGDWHRAVITFTAIVLGSGVAHQINYWAGKLLVGPKRIVQEPSEGAPSLLEAFASYWHPHLGSLYSLRSGSDNVPYDQFLSRFFVAFGCWNLFWGILMYQLGRVPLSGSEFLLLFYIYLAWWIFQELRMIRRGKKSVVPH